ncbi:hypothetical protein J4433_02125 [Candidatus Pacearchaeota archaeon]|nr:hypothetical protein [Candidatus Pacearchaeota archaeon]
MARKLEKSLENQRCRIERFEVDKRGYAKMTIKTKSGEYGFPLKNETARKLWLGDILTCKLGVCSSPDFLGDRVEDMKAATMSYEIAELKDKKGNIIYKK